MTDIIRNETAHTINGVSGRLFTLRRPPAPWQTGTFANQKWISESRIVDGYGENAFMHVEMRFDDNCKNGQNDFAITAEIKNYRRVEACGCLHDDIREVFPELAHLIKWHLCSTDGPMHYIANTTYHASDRDYNGRTMGEPSAWDEIVYIGDSPVHYKLSQRHYKFFAFLRDRMTEQKDGTFKCVSELGEFNVYAIHHDNKPGEHAYKPKYTFIDYGEKWHECPFDDEFTALEWVQAINAGKPLKFVKIPTAYSEGKARDLSAARNCAVWPDATDEQLCLPKAELTALLNDRLPALLDAMRADIEAAGFMWKCPAV